MKQCETSLKEKVTPPDLLDIFRLLESCNSYYDLCSMFEDDGPIKMFALFIASSLFTVDSVSSKINDFNFVKGSV